MQRYAFFRRAPGDPPLMLLADRRSVAACKLALNACWLPNKVLASIMGEGSDMTSSSISYGD